MNPTIKARIESIRRGEVPEGYKRTKIGIVPNEWVTNVTLKSICTINPKTEQLPDQFIYIDLESVVDGVLVSKKIIKKSNAPSRAQRVLQVNDVIYQMVRPYQRNNYLFCHESKCYKYVASTGYAQLRAKCYAFLYYLINSDYFCAQVLEKCTGSNYPAINSEDLASISITYPKKEAEQQKIAEILAGQDRVIALKEKLLAEKQKQKKYLMQQLLTAKKRLPGFSGEWKRGELGDIVVECNDGSTPSRKNSDYFNGDINWVVVEDIIPYIYSTKEKLSKKGIESANLKVWKKGTVIVSTCASIGLVGILCCEAATKQGITAILVDENNSNEYIRFWLENEKLTLLKFAQGSSIREIRSPMLLKLKINYPCLQEQVAIVKILLTADKEIELLQKDIEQEKLMKKSLMQLLLTGIVRVDELVS